MYTTQRHCIYKRCSFGCFNMNHHRAKYSKLNYVQEKKIEKSIIPTGVENTSFDYSKLLTLFDSENKIENNK